MKAQYLRVKNWERFQHYKDRTPPWIKYHVTLLDDRDMLSLPYATQLVYDRLLLWAARTDNNIDHDPIWLGQKFNIEALVVQEAIENLLTAGFLVMAGRKRHASKAIATRTAKELAEREQGAVPEAEAESRGEADTEAEADGDSGGSLFAVPRSADLQGEIQKLLKLRGCDANSSIVVAVYAKKLPFAAVADIRQRAEQGHKPVKWAVTAMQEQIKERSAA